ncbi:serine protease 27-like [Alosa sapidissima]|uniref:serine protease 27-like n=1 Tax=Alosa sapidissima TaxID=34773 RepID=UPI001C08649F|nr:serine protease 27-like [Alosa sapidissima]
MNLQTLLYVMVLLCKLTGCLSIVGGRDAHRGAWPWMVHLGMHSKHDKTICGGSLVSDQWVLSASSCLKEFIDLERWFAWVGELSLREPSGRLVKLKRVVQHSDYRWDETNHSLYNDIALVQLQEAVSFSDTVKPVILPSPRDVFSPDTECWVTGWGDVAEGTPLGGKQTLQEVQVSLVDDATCRRIYPETTDRMLCAGDPRGGKDSCQSDSGAPLVCVLAGEERRFVQVGIVSFGQGCARVGLPGVYTHVLSYTQFIRDIIQETECNDLPPFEACFL